MSLLYEPIFYNHFIQEMRKIMTIFNTKTIVMF